MSTFFQPPHRSAGSRTIYTVLHEQAQNRNNDTHESEHSSQLYSPTPSSSSLSSASPNSGSSCGPSSPSRSDKSTSPNHCASSYQYDEFEDWINFDATDVDQLNAFVPASLGHAIDAAKYSSLGDFGTEICWEALPPIFALPNAKSRSKRHDSERSSLAQGIDDIPLLSELTEEQQRIVIEYLEECRSCFAAMDEVEEVAARANLPPAFILYYLSLI